LSLKRLILLLVLLTIGVIVVFGFLRSSPAEVPFGRASRQDLVSTLVTNGQVAPQRFSEIRAESGGRVNSIKVRQGEHVSAGGLVLSLDSTDAAARIAEAQVALRSAEERLNQIRAGGPPLAQAEMESGIASVELDLAAAKRDAASLRKLVAQEAATPEELRIQEARVASLQSRLEGLRKQRSSLVAPADQASAEAAVSQARATLVVAHRNAAQRSLRSPIAGTLYEFLVQDGTWLNPGDLVGKVGDLEQVRVSVYVDEPELGKVKMGQPVTIRWDARPGQTWTGEVNQLPARIQSFGTRQVGEVVCLIANPGADLLPGTNVNVEIESARVAGALVIPKQALRRRLGADGVWKLVDGTVRWQEIRTGISNLTAVEVREGLVEGDSAALIYDRELKEAMPVRPVYP
jgi:HlyD family secretion protein